MASWFEDAIEATRWTWKDGVRIAIVIALLFAAGWIVR